MSESTGRLVECPICGDEFDPQAAGGWCTNPDCGEWRTEESDVPRSEAPIGENADGTEREGDHGDDDNGAAAAETDEDQSAGTEPDAPAAGETAADAADGGAGGDGSDDAPSGDRTDDTADDDAADTTDDDATDTAADADEDVPTGDASTADGPDGADGATAACPSCGATVEPDDRFCAKCGAELDDASATLEACPACGTDVDEGDRFCATCGENLDEHRPGAAGDESADAPAALVLRSRGRSIRVGDGETVGRRIRSLITETGGDQDEAVRVHREHIRFVRESGQFHLVNLGENPTRLNGRPLKKGERTAIEPGDRLELSGVVTLDVEAPEA